MQIRWARFVDQKGNEFIFPSMNTANMLATAMWHKAKMVEVSLGVRSMEDFKPTPCGGTPDDPRFDFPRVVADAGSRGFAHGSAEVWLLAGPEFDAIAAMPLEEEDEVHAD